MAIVALGLSANAQQADAKVTQASLKGAGNKNFAAEHSRSVDQKIAEEKAARQAKTAELQKKRSEEVTAKAKKDRVMMTPQKSNAPAQKATQTAEVKTVTPVSAQPHVATVKPVRDEAAIRANAEKQRAQKAQNVQKPVSKTSNKVVAPSSKDTRVQNTTAATTTTASVNAKPNMTNEERVAQMNERNAAIHAKEKQNAAAANHAPVKPVQKTWPTEEKKATK
ncbi:MAG: hypothetical protein JWO06_1915 [Bacteroidota bacterium]|nr:hypothetical protein [Bacteroidota bacterium]